MLKRCLTILVLIWGCLLYVPTARACEESPLPYLMDYQAFLSEYRAAIAEGRDTIGDWPLSAAAKVAGPEGTGYAFVWMDEDSVPELLIGDPEDWHVWQAYTWKDGKIYNLYPEGDPSGEMWVTEDRLLYLDIATMTWSHHAWSGKRAHATDLWFKAAYTQDLETHTIRFYRDERDEDGVPIWHEVRMDVENVIAMMPTTRMLELDWQWLSDLSVPADREHDFETGPTLFYRGEDDTT